LHEYIEIKNAKIHNLKGLDVKIPKNKLTVITGVSGSGKSSLAFDTLYEEGRRRYLLFSGTQFMIDNEQSFDEINGLSPTVAVEQRIIRQSNPRSTVGTRTKLESMLAALYANYGEVDSKYDTGEPLEISMFQKNSPRGMCVKCMGKGTVYRVLEDELFNNKSIRLEQLFEDIADNGHYHRMLVKYERATGSTREKRIDELTLEEFNKFKYGCENFEGLNSWLIQSYHWSKGKSNWISKVSCVKEVSCPKCYGSGINEMAFHTKVLDKTLMDMEHMYIDDLCALLKEYKGKKSSLLDEIVKKLECLMEVGLHHLSLARPIPTLSGGEIQRLFLASYILAEMDSIIFIFDEPTIGLHETEKANLIQIIRKLVKAGNTVVCVEHDENFMREADYIIDIGPEAGIRGGVKIYEGGFHEFLTCNNSKTAPYLSDEKRFGIRSEYRKWDSNKSLRIIGANIHNLKNITVNIPLGVMVGIAGVSGSGKSSLIADTLVPKLKEIMKTKCIIEDEVTDIVNARLEGCEQIKKCYVIDQRPIGRSKTSCPATYTGLYDRIRSLFAATEEAKQKELTVGVFSVNSEGGCDKCKGDGVVHYHVGFGNYLDIPCEECNGTGFIPEALEITLDGKNIYDVLQLSVEEASNYFADKDAIICNMLSVLKRVGMGYIKLGQSTPTISGGESQRIKLAKELAKGKHAKGCLYILDEPTTGLSFHDTERLMVLLNELVDMGNSIIITEHDPYVLSNCDYILEMGVGGGNEGGNLIAEGTPKELKKNIASIIGRYLK
jgi:excinuclease ABC A subunit